eukprot:215682-Chlamydomonas_euryale.AAC.2
MSLLLAFRLNRTYERWRQARSSLASVGVHAASAFMQARRLEARRWTPRRQQAHSFAPACSTRCLHTLPARCSHP